MLVFAENKRKVLATFLTVAALVAIGFGIGRLTASSTSVAQAAATKPSTGGMTSLRHQLAGWRAAASATSTQLAIERKHNATLTKRVSQSNVQLAAVRGCGQIKAPKPIRRCVEGVLR